MGLIRAILDGSSLVREEREQAAAEGFAEGRAEEAHGLLRIVRKKKFPELQFLQAIDHISDIETLDGLIERAFEAPHSDSMREAILAAAKTCITPAAVKS